MMIAALAFMITSLPPMLQDVHRIVCMGDSITQMGDPGHGYVAQIRSDLAAIFPDHPIEVINVGISGQKAPDMLARFQKDVVDKHPDLATLSVGINDVWHGFYSGHPDGDGPQGVPIDVYERDVRLMVDLAQSNNIRMVLVSPTVITEDPATKENQKLQKYVDVEREIAREKRIPFVDLHKVFLSELKSRGANGKSLKLTMDGVHMKPDGDKIMAHEILAAMGVPTKKSS